MCTHMSCTLVLPAEESKNNDPPVAMNLLSPKSWFLKPFPFKMNQDYLEKWLIQGQGRYQWV